MKENNIIDKLRKSVEVFGILFGIMFVSLVFSSNASAACPTDPTTATNTGTSTSGVIDNVEPVLYTTVNLTATTPSDTCVGIRVRSGNTIIPDGTWQTWSGLLSDGDEISAYSGRYVQYQLVFGSDDINNVPSISSVTINHAVFDSPATLGSPSASSIGLRADTGTDALSKAVSLSWDATTDASGQKVLFKVRAGDSQAELDDNICYGPGTGAEGSGLDDGCADWSTAGKFFSQIYGESNSSNAIDTAISNKRYIEVLVRLESSGSNTPVLNEVTLTYDTLEAPDPNTIKLTKSDDSTIYLADGNPVTVGLAGGYTSESGIKIATSTAITCEDCTSDNRVLEVEVQPVGDVFTDTATETGSIDNVNYLSAATISGLSPGQYHLQYRASDGQGRQTAWTSYGNNAEDIADFTVEQTPPTITTFTINSGSEYTSSNLVTLNIEASDAGSKLGKIYASNNGTDWTDVTTQVTNFIGQASFSGNIESWDIGTGDGAKDVYVKVEDNGGNTSGTWTETTDEDFNLGTSDDVITEDNEIKLIENEYPTADPENPNWYDGRVGTAMEGKQVYKNDETVDKYATGRISCRNPQCELGIDSGVPANYSLVSPQENPTVDFSAYPAQDACKARGGRLPYKNELLELRAAQGSYGGNFANGTGYEHWSATENLTNYGHTLTFQTNLWGNSFKDYDQVFRCVRDLIGQFSTSGTFTSQVHNSGQQTTNLGTVTFNTETPEGTAIVVSARAGNTATPDGTWTDWQALTSGQDAPAALDNHQYLQYKAELTGDGTATPTLYDISFESASGSSITLDTAPPSAFDLSTPSSGTWSQDDDPTLSWSASSDENSYVYDLYIDDELDTADIDSGTTSITPTTPFTEANHTWYIVARDAAGNETQSTSTFNYGYDNTAPTLALDPGFTFTASDSNSDDITLTWNTYADDSGDGSPATTYSIERLRYSIYDANSHTLISDWSVEDAEHYELIGNQTSPYVNSVGETEADIEQAVKYIYRIKVTDTAGNVSNWLVSNTGLTSDGIDPTNPSDVVASACDGSAPDPCPDTDPVDSSSNTAGYSMKLTWTASSDTGSGVTGYKIYRIPTSDSSVEANWEDNVVGYLDVDPPGAPISTVWYDNDTHNTETYTDTFNGEEVTVKSAASPKLNDYVTYFYRITALDDSGNETSIITTSGVPPVTTYTNWAEGRTLDVTDPSVPTNLTVTPVGVDSQENDPLTQQMDISWGASSDKVQEDPPRTPECVAGTTGCSIKEYVLEQALGNESGPTEAYAEIYRGPNLNYSKDGLTEDTYYYYKVKAIDKADLESSFTAELGEQTKNSQVPTTPTAVTVEAHEGNPNTDDTVGYTLDITFSGSRITGTGNKVTGYAVYRSTDNTLLRSEWKSLTPIKTYTDLNIAADVQDGERSFTDTVPTDATTYYYKVEALGWNESNQEVVESPSLSAISPDTLGLGWDTTPDATAPTQPLEVTVKDIHGDGTSLYRNIVTWQRLDTSLAANKRNGTVDFAEYRVYRYTADTIDSPELLVTYDDLSQNYCVDGITFAELPEGGTDYYYYVVAVDNADTTYKYPAPNEETIVNNVANVSDYLTPVSINPEIAKPTVSGATPTNVGVSSATIEWETNQDCDSVVEYKVEDSSEVLTSGKNRQTPTQDHSVTLNSLAKNETYYYRIISENSLGNASEVQSTTWPESQKFTTKDFAITHDKKADVSTTTTTATIRWSTNVAADSMVEYKEEASAESSKSSGDPNLTTTHTVSVNGLKPSTTYTYKIRSVTADNYIADTTFATYSTKAYDSSQFVISPSASNIAEENITATSAKIVWNTAIATDTWVDYGTAAGNYNQSTGEDKYNTVHVVELKNLTPGTTYFYRVRGTDTNGIEYTSQEYSFTAVLKPEITNIKVNVLDSYTARVTFDTNVSAESVVVYGPDGTTTLRAGSSEYLKNHNLELTDLTDATTYSYYIEVKDQLGNSAKSTTSTFETPIDKTGAKVEGLKVDILPMGESDETASVIISWNTNKPTTTKVEYDEGVVGDTFGSSTIEDESLNTSHTVIIKELIPSTTYRFRLAGKDKRENLTSSDSYTFVTPGKEKSILQLILKSLEETFSWVRNVGGFFRGLGQKVQ
ncbi:MAG: fibronectin type III domain-containing protein [Patescibacteria group bacterium]|nr:fibronectin type III domain-containing protein [Patescibacteria group bacterium]